jgi:cytoskeleton protein RodZ
MSDEMNEADSVTQSEVIASTEESIGATLKQARIGHGWDVDDIDRITHISPGWVVVIENGDWNQYPSMVYAKGHVRAYADALDLEVEPIIEKFQKEWDKKIVPDGHDAVLLNRSGISLKESGTSQKSILLFLTVSGLLVMVGIAVWYAVSSRSKSSKDVTMVNPPLTTPPTKSPSISTLQPEKDAAPSMGKLDVSPSAPTPPASGQGPSSLNPSAQPPPTALLNGSIQGSVTAEKTSLSLKMVAIKSTWVVISVDDGSVRRFHLKSGESKTLTGKNFMTFSTGIGDGLVLFLNGRRLGLAGLTGDPVMHRRITRGSFRVQKKLQKKPLPALSKPNLNPQKTSFDPETILSRPGTNHAQIPATSGSMPLVPVKPEVPSQSKPVNSTTTNQAEGLP